MPDPHLKKAMREIVAVLKRYRIGGAITLVSRSHAEFRYEFPHWSVIQPEQGPHGEEGLRMRSFQAYYARPEEQKKDQEDSLHCLLQMRDLSAQTFAVMDNLAAQIKAVVPYHHRPFSGFEPGA